MAVSLSVTLALLAVGAAADAAAPAAPTWETAIPGTLDADEIPVAVVAAPTTVNAGDGAYVFSTATKPSAAEALGIDDRDVVVTVLDPDGTIRESSVFDEGPGTGLGRDEVLVDVEVDGNNNLAYLLLQSGPDALYRKVATRDGRFADGSYSTLDLPGVTVADVDRTDPGGWLGVAGQSAPNRWYAASIANGTAVLEFEDTSVAGVANAVALPDGPSVNRTMVVTGERFGFDQQGIRTVSYRYRPAAGEEPIRWVRESYDQDSRYEQGVAVDLADTPTGRHVFVAAETTTIDGDWDTLVLSYDDADGADRWAAPVRIASADGGDERPVAIQHHDGVVYVAGTIGGLDASVDVVVVALDAASGAELSRRVVSGTAARDDRVADLDVTHDRVILSVALEDVEGTRAGIVAFDHLLRPAGAAFLTGASEIAGADETVDGDLVLTGARFDASTGYDTVVARVAAADLAVLPIVSVMTVTAPAAVSALDAAPIVVRLSDEDGRPIADADVTLELVGAGLDDVRSLRTDVGGVARLDVTPTRIGTLDVTAVDEGDGVIRPSDASATVTVTARDALLEVRVDGNGRNRSVTVALSDRDGAPLAGKTVTVIADGVEVAAGTTDGDGQFSVTAPPGSRRDATVFAGRFDGDDVYAPAEASAS